MTYGRFGQSMPVRALLAAVLAVGLASCSDQGGSGNTATGGAATGGSGSSGALLTGAGATFPAPLYQQWFAAYAQSTGVKVNYQAIGSGGGIKAITAKSVDFGASDAPMSDEELSKAPGVVHIPTVAGAVTVAYNVPGLGSGLRLDGPTIARIFLGAVPRWNDPAIAALNPGKKLPNVPIEPFHRADGSGTTNIFTTYLAAVSPQWKASVGAGKSVRWPKGLGGKGNAGVAALIQQNAGGIGYIELAYALQNKIAFADVKNSSGAFVTPSVASTTAAASGVKLPPDFRTVIVNTSAADGYPITGYTFLLVYPNCKPDVKKLFHWMLTDGQKDAASLNYAPLPPAVAKAALAKVDAFT